MPTREEAVEKLFSLINSGILSGEMEEALEDIVKCIEAEEEQGIFIWGAKENDWAELYVAYREDLWTDELKQKMQQIHDKYKIKGGE